MDENSYKNIHIYCIGYATIKYLKYVISLYLNINIVNGYFEEINRNKYLTLFPTNESKEKIKII